jgi:hypothetical protein
MRFVGELPQSDKLVDFSQGTLVSSTNKINRHDITEVLLNGLKHQ